jgi:hypothetical protein
MIEVLNTALTASFERKTAMIGLVVVLALILLVALLAPWFGVDTRDGRDWQPDPDHVRPGLPG